MAQLREVQANGIRFSYLEQGRGRRVALLLHGFPDNAHSWERQMPVLADAGYRVVAPFLRGYPPTEVPAKGYYDRGTLATDIKALIEALGGGEPVDLVAQDWGAAISYGVMAAFPEKIRRAVLLAVPHPAVVRATLRRSPRQAIRSFHWYLFQLPWLPERLCRANDFAFIEFLWRIWSPAYDDHRHVAQIKRTLAQPGAMEATLSYYRALFHQNLQDPKLAALRGRLDRKIPVPTRVVCGTHDMRKEMLEPGRAYFSGDYEWTTVEGAGHFLHREKPDVVNRLILDWLRR
jgi:pimeloyl-ACP methyl ester carboxylesterase